MELDVERSFFDIYGSKAQVFQQLLQATSYQFRQAHPEKLLKNLRFPQFRKMCDYLLHQNRSKVKHSEDFRTSFEPNNGYTENDSDCICKRLQPFSKMHEVADVQRTSTLILTEPGDLVGCTHYVAVSYCWRQPHVNSLASNAIPVGYEIRTARGVRRNRAPTNVIHRTISYAAERVRCLIWIDQECINQEDPADKEEHIQAMHLIFRHADQVVTVLNSPIMTWQHIDTIDALGYCDGHKFSKSENSGDELDVKLRDPSFLGKALEGAEAITGDLWNTRAWTLQESIQAACPLHFLIPCENSLQRPAWLGSISQQLMLSESFPFEAFHEVFHGVFKLQPVNSEMSNESLAALFTRAETVEEFVANIPGCKMERTGKPEFTYHRLGAIDACRLLLDRGISENSDLIAIVGNLCQYSIRLDTRRINVSGLGFSICAFALALLNGDMNLLLAQESGKQPSSEVDAAKKLWCSLHHLPLSNLGDMASWTHFQYSRSRVCRVNPPVPTSSGLLISGFLWDLGHEVDLQIIKRRFSYRWETELSADNGDEVFMEEVLWGVLTYLYDRGHIALLRVTFLNSCCQQIPAYVDHTLRQILLSYLIDRGDECVSHPRWKLPVEVWFVRSVLNQIMKYGKLFLGCMVRIPCYCPAERALPYVIRHKTRLSVSFYTTSGLGKGGA